MSLRSLLLAPALAAVGLLAAGAGGASAATLFTTTAHTTRVTVGTPVTATSTSFTPTFATGHATTSCAPATLEMEVRENSDARVALTVTGGTFSCGGGFMALLPWNFTVLGSAVVVGGAARYLATADNFGFTFPSAGRWQGNLTTGVTATESVTGTAPVCIELDDAHGWTVTTGGDETVDGRFCLGGAGAGWSLG